MSHELEHRSFDGDHVAHIGHGPDCVFIQLDRARAIVFTAEQAREFADALVWQADGALGLEGEPRFAPAVPDSGQGHAKPTGDTRGAA